MGRRGKSAKKAARAARAAARRAAEEELRAAVEREGDARRQAAYSVAKAFVKQFMPRIERFLRCLLCPAEVEGDEEEGEEEQDDGYV